MSTANGVVHCDHDGCEAWVQPRTPGDTQDAYDYAESIGWTLRSPLDLCPAHVISEGTP